jgi:hypothetical protein
MIVYVPDLKYTIRTLVVYINRETIGGLVDLNHYILSSS